MFARHGSEIDWCELNYAVTPYIAEFQNTVTGFLVVLLVPLYMIVDSEQSFYKRVDTKLRLIYLLMILAGIGSAYFHTTLSLAGQLIDELSVVWLVFFGCLFIHSPKGKDRWAQIHMVLLTPTNLLLYLVVTCGLAFAEPILSHVICVLHLPFGIWRFCVEFKECTCERAARIFYLGLFFIILAFFCWFLDRVACDSLHTIAPWLEFHALWHIFAYCSVWCCLVVGTHMRATQDGFEPEIRLEKGLPYTRVLAV